jgi:RNA polymerase sigma factor (sigma-70 family)
MATSAIVRLLRRVAEDGGIKQMTDLELLGRFSLEHDEEAFLGLMRRHGSMVLDVCRNVLGNESDAEDAFQVTFLVLAQKAGAIRKPESVGSWLYGVAFRTAHKARADTARRQKCEGRVPGQTPARACDLTWAETQHILHDELSRVSDYYRTPLVACYLEGKTQDEAAALLGVSKATVRNRLELEPPALVLLLSPTLRQSGELFRDKVVRLYGALGRPVPPVQETALTMGLANGSRIVSLPGDEKNIRGYSGVSLLIVDEAARVEDSLCYAVRPMLAVSGGSMVCLSTPYGKRGWFHEAWSGNERWDRYRITAKDCPRITSAFLDEERRALGPRWYAQEYECSFEDAVDQVFAYADIMAALSPDLEPLSLE